MNQLAPLGIDELIVSLSQRQVAEGELFSAERLLHGPTRPDRVLELNELVHSPQRVAALAKVYVKSTLYPDALAALRSISAGSEDQLQASDQRVDEGEISLSDLQRQASEAIGNASGQLNVDAPVTLTWHQQSQPGSARATFTQRVVHPSLQGSETFKGWKVINSGGAVMFQHPDGESFQLPMDEFRSVRTSDRKAAISGGLMILERPGRITAIDLLAIRSRRRNDALLWSRDFGADGSSLTTRKIDTTAFGDSNFSYPTNAGTADMISEFRVGPLLGDRILVLQAGDLLAIDTANKETLWRNSDAPPVGQMVVDQGRVAVVSYLKGMLSKVTTFDLLDGRKLTTSPWEHGKVWSTSGKHVLTYVEDAKASSATVRLVNPFNGDVVLEVDALVKLPLKKDVGRGMGRVIQNRFLVLLDTTGRLLIWDLLRGTELARHELDAIPDLESVYTMWMEGRILVVASDAVIREKDDKLVQQGEIHRPVHRLISVSTETGQLDWVRQFDEPWGITVEQPFGSPVVLLSRSRTIYAVNRSTRKLDLAMIRLRDGKTIHEELDHAVAPRTAGLTTIVTSQPAFGRLEARIDGEKLIYEFGKAQSPDQQPPQQ